jgi:hypothetical protein
MRFIKNREKKWKPKSDFDYLVLGMLYGQKLRRECNKNKPIYTPSKIITLK